MMEKKERTTICHVRKEEEEPLTAMIRRNTNCHDGKDGEDLDQMEP
jgi:hypothetical protein